MDRLPHFQVAGAIGAITCKVSSGRPVPQPVQVATEPHAGPGDAWAGGGDSLGFSRKDGDPPLWRGEPTETVTSWFSISVTTQNNGDLSSLLADMIVRALAITCPCLVE